MAKWGQRLAVFISAPFIIAYFTPQQYGYLTLINTLASFCSIIGMLAIVDQGLPRFFLDSEDENAKQSYATTSLFMSGISILTTVVLILTATPIIPIFFKDINDPIIFSMLIALVCLTYSLRHTSGNMLKWTFQASLFTKINLLQAIIATGIIISGIIFLGWRAKAVLLITALTTLGAAVWASHAIRRYIRFYLFSRKKAQELMVYSWPLLGVNIFAFFTRSLDRIFLASLTSLSVVGIFSVASAVAGIFETLVSGFFFALGPHILSTFREPNAPKRYASLFNMLSCLGLISIACLGLWGGPVVMLLRPEGTYQHIGVFIPWIICGALIYHLGGYFTPGPDIAKKTHWKFVGFMIAAVLNAILNYLLIPPMGILGACLATTTASFLAAVFNISISNRLYAIPLRWLFSFSMIMVYAISVSFLQQNHLTMNVTLSQMLFRSLLTLAFVIFAILIYHRDLKVLIAYAR